jgi:hypothetical protein
MQNILNRALAVSALALVLGAVAGATEVTPTAVQAAVEKPWLVRFGFNSLSATTGRDLTSQNGIEFGIGRQLNVGGLFKSNAQSFVEFTGRINRGNSSGTGDVFGIQFVERVLLDAAGGTDRGFYAGYGAGVQLVRVKGRFGSPVANPGGGGGNGGGSGGNAAANPIRFNANGSRMADETRFSIGGRVLAGFKFNPLTSAEFAHNFGPKVDGVSTDSVSLTVGFRF